MRRSSSGKVLGQGSRGESDIEWVGGLFRAPFYVTDADEPYRPELAIWMELPSGLVVGYETISPGESSGALGRTLINTLRHPAVGPPRRPDRVRIADPTLRPEVHRALGERVPIEVAPTPEFDELIQSMIEHFSEDEPDVGYLVAGRIPAESMDRLFRSAKVLFALKPWTKAQDGQFIRVDIPSLGVEGACISIIGALGESFGFLVFDSLDAIHAFLRSGEAYREGEGPLDAGTDWLAVEFERGANLPDVMRREVAEHGWPVAGPDAYPVVEHRERDGVVRPPTVRDIDIAEACTRALSSFLIQKGNIFDDEGFEPVSGSFFDENDREVRLTYPYEAFDEFEPVSPGPAVRAKPKVSRNAPCPCGSGLKYKKCHLPADQANQGREGGHPQFRELEDRVVGELLRFASRRFSKDWMAFEKIFKSPEDALGLMVPWSVYGFHVDGRTVADAYLEAEGKRCSPEVRAWLAAQRAAWLSVWEVVAVEPGKSVTLRDHLSGESRRVTDSSASRTAETGQNVLVRVVDSQGVSIMCGAHPRTLPPLAAAEVVRKARARLRLRREVPVERLQDPAFGQYLIKRWENAVEDLDTLRSIPPVLHNTDGDPFLATTDRFDIVPGARHEIEERLALLKGVDLDDSDSQELAFVFIRRGKRNAGGLGTIVTGRALVRGSTLRLETNSRKRADALRKQVEKACGDRVRYVGRVHADPLSSGAPRGSAPPAPPTPEMNRILREYKEHHYADWADHPLPALAGQTPREAVRTRKGREAVHTLLREMEYLERQAGEAAYDFTGIRQDLGIP